METGTENGGVTTGKAIPVSQVKYHVTDYAERERLREAWLEFTTKPKAKPTTNKKPTKKQILNDL